MKIIKTILFIFLVILPMLIYLNPFTWGMGRVIQYLPSQKTVDLMETLKEKYNLDIYIAEYNDTIWYFRDLNNGKITQKANFKMRVFTIDYREILDTNHLINYVKEFESKFEHRRYFDSIIVIQDDNVVYKTK